MLRVSFRLPVQALGLRVLPSLRSLGVSGLGFRAEVSDLGFRANVSGLGFRGKVSGLGFGGKVSGLGFRV